VKYRKGREYLSIFRLEIKQRDKGDKRRKNEIYRQGCESADGGF